VLHAGRGRRVEEDEEDEEALRHKWLPGFVHNRVTMLFLPPTLPPVMLPHELHDRELRELMRMERLLSMLTAHARYPSPSSSPDTPRSARVQCGLGHRERARASLLCPPHLMSDSCWISLRFNWSGHDFVARASLLWPPPHLMSDSHQISPLSTLRTSDAPGLVRAGPNKNLFYTKLLYFCKTYFCYITVLKSVFYNIQLAHLPRYSLIPIYRVYSFLG
jgi:hypothetical protein